MFPIKLSTECLYRPLLLLGQSDLSPRRGSRLLRMRRIFPFLPSEHWGLDVILYRHPSSSPVSCSSYCLHSSAPATTFWRWINFAWPLCVIVSEIKTTWPVVDEVVDEVVEQLKLQLALQEIYILYKKNVGRRTKILIIIPCRLILVSCSSCCPAAPHTLWWWWSLKELWSVLYRPRCCWDRMITTKSPLFCCWLMMEISSSEGLISTPGKVTKEQKVPGIKFCSQLYHQSLLLCCQQPSSDQNRGGDEDNMLILI